MKILIVSPDLRERHGWSSYANHLAGCLQERGHAVTVASPAEGLPQPGQIYRRPWFAPLYARTLQQKIRAANPDIVHTTAEPYACLVPFLPQDIVEKTILTIHGTYGVVPLREWAIRPLAKRYYRRIPRFICVSNYTKRAVTDTIQPFAPEIAGHFAQCARVVHNGIPIPPQVAQTEHAKKNILLVGGVKQRKGVLEALNACEAYKRRSATPFVFTVIGTAHEGNEYMQQVRRRIAELQLQDDVMIAGVLSDTELAKRYASADLLLLPAHTGKEDFEGFGLVYLEANAYGVPCIGPNTSGAAEAISDGKSGFRCDARNPEDIAEKMHRILNGGAIKRADCRAWAEAHDIKHMTDQTVAVYRELIGER